MKFKIRDSAGYTLIEFIIVIAIVSILASIVTPQMNILVRKAGQATSKSNLGMMRTVIGVYYADMEGTYPFQRYPDGYLPYANGMSLSEVLCPRYLKELPTPRLYNPLLTVAGFDFDILAANAMKSNPVKDISIINGTPGAVVADTPFIYDSLNGHMYICNDNIDTNGNNFFNW